MIIKLDLTIRQLSYLIAAMSWRLRTDDITEIIRDHEKGWGFKSGLAHEFAERCDLLAMLETTFNSATEEQEEDDDEDK